MPHPPVSDLSCDVLVIGAGLAGVTAALALPPHLSVIMLCKEHFKACSSFYAQGGIAASLSSGDSVAEHVHDTLIAGDGLCNPAATEHILSQGRAAIDWLLSMGVPFSAKSISQSPNTHPSSTHHQRLHVDQLHLTQEGGHTHRRVAHAEDATGKHIMTALISHVLARTNIQVLSHHEAVSLTAVPMPAQSGVEHGVDHLTSDPNDSSESKAGTEAKAKAGALSDADQLASFANCHRIAGAQVLDATSQILRQIKANVVVLATGGLGQLFKRATAPDVCLGDGLMMAWQAGCRLANLEFVQFHPTGLAHADSNFLISEAVRGEGGVLINPKTKRAFMADYDARAELAPRDVVARAISQEMLTHNLPAVHLDISHRPLSFILSHFPDIHAHCLSLGLDIATTPIPVAPTAHYTCGGVMTDAHGQTDVAGLYAAGEVAYTGLHGANRLASNSLLECVVMGRVLAQHIASHQSQSPSPRPQPTFASDTATDDAFTDGTFEACHHQVSYQHPDQEASMQNHCQNLEQLPKTSQPPEVVDIDFINSDPLLALKQLMSDSLGIYRTRSSMLKAQRQLLSWQNRLKAHTKAHIKIGTNDGHDMTQDHDVLSGTDLHQNPSSWGAWRYERLLLLCQMMLSCALLREESRGGHYRDDHRQQYDAVCISVLLPGSLTPQLMPLCVSTHAALCTR